MLDMIGAAAWAAAAGLAPAPGQAPAAQAHAEEIVITAQRSGVPMWTVRSETTTLVLVGSIRGVSKTTQWNPAGLIEALRKADRVVFPEMHSFTASPFSLFGWIAKWNAMGSLPKGQSLGDFASADDMRRLAALSVQGKVRKDYATRHPLHLAGDLREHAEEGVKFGRDAAAYVRSAVKDYKIDLVPVPDEKAKPLVKDLFASTPAEHVPCLHAAIAVAEAGPAAIQARSDAWAARRVTAVLRSPVKAMGETCWPGARVAAAPEALVARMKQLLAEPKVTVAVLSLGTLADRGGVLDALEAAGFDIQGPSWKD
jgi:uncharacterized protein YbaP (TraB family)